MDARQNRLSLLYGVPGIGLQIAGALTPEAFPRGSPLPLLISLAGTALLLVGLGYYAKAKGHSAVWCLMGFLSCIGLLVLALLPDRKQTERV